MGRIDPGATIDRDCRGKSPIESMATSTLATRSPVLNRWLTRPLFKLTIFFLTAAPMTMGAEWEVEYFGTVAEPLRIHWTYQRLPNDGSRYIGLFNDSVCESLTPMILSDDDPSRGIGRLVIWCADQGPDQRPCVKCEYDISRVNASLLHHANRHSNRCCVKPCTAVTSVRNPYGLNVGKSGCVNSGEFYCYPNSCYRFGTDEFGTQEWGFVPQFSVVLLWTLCCWALRWYTQAEAEKGESVIGAGPSCDHSSSYLSRATPDVGDQPCVIGSGTSCDHATETLSQRVNRRGRVLHTRVARANVANLLRGLGGLKMQNLLVLTLMLFLPLVSGADNDGPKGDRWRPPQFSGTRDGFQKWWLAFVAWLAYVLPDTADIVEKFEDDREEKREAEKAGKLFEPKFQRAVTEDEDGAETVRANRKLYGAISAAMPAWLQQSLHLKKECRNNGSHTLKNLWDRFGAVDATDRAHAAKRLHARYLDDNADISEEGVRLQMDQMLMAALDLIRAGGGEQDDMIMISFFDLAMPPSYATIRSMVRREGHQSFEAHVNDYLSQVKAELACRNTQRRVHGLFGQPQGDEQPQSDGLMGGRRGHIICFGCLQKGHSAADCPKGPHKCTHCGGNHNSKVCFSPGAPGSDARDALPKKSKAILQSICARREEMKTQKSRKPMAAVAKTGSAEIEKSDKTEVIDPEMQSSKLDEAYMAGLEAGMRRHGFMATCGSPQGCAVTRPPVLSAARNSPLPERVTRRSECFVDSMATLFILKDPKAFVRFTDTSPRFGIEQLDSESEVPVDAVGDIGLYLFAEESGTWRYFEVKGALLVKNGRNLYSTQEMYSQHGVTHLFDGSCRIELPKRRGQSKDWVSIDHRSGAFVVPVAFGPPPPRHGLIGRSPVTPASMEGGAVVPRPVSGTPQAILWQRLGFPYGSSWRHVPDMMLGIGLPENVTMNCQLMASDAVMRGRARARPFFSSGANLVDKSLPPPGAVIHCDFSGPLIPSFVHKFTAYSGFTDKGTSYSRHFPVRDMTKETASETLEAFLADLSSKMGVTHPLKCERIICDGGPAYVSGHFGEFVEARLKSQRVFSAPYTPEQNGIVERSWGTTFALARTLLIAASLPPSFHPHAVQTARWILNRLPMPSRMNRSPFFLLTKRAADIGYLRSFGCLCRVYLPVQLRTGDRHLSDRGAAGVYLGPSENHSAAVTYLPRQRRFLIVAKMECYEDSFPGVGTAFDWDKMLEGRPRDDTAYSGGDAPLSRDTNDAPDGSVDPPPHPSDPAPDDPPVSNRTGSDAGPPDTDPEMSAPVEFTSEAPVEVPRETPKAPPKELPGADTPKSNTGARPKPAELDSEEQFPPERIDPSLDPSSRFFRRVVPARDRRGAAEGRYTPVDFRPVAKRAFISAAIADPSRGMPAFCYVDDICHMDHHTFGFKAVASTHTAEFGDVQIPRSYKEAVTSRHSSYWKEAISKEISGLVGLKTWEYVPLASLPPEANIMQCHFIFAVKRKSDGSIEKFKARLVANGNTQKAGVDFDAIFAAVVRLSTVRMVLAMACRLGYNITSTDVRQAYLQAELSGDRKSLYMRVPPGLPREIEGRPAVCKLLRSLYGLKQAGREWNKLFVTFLLGYGFTRSTIDTCLFVLVNQGVTMWVLVYVDDLLIVDNNTKARNLFVGALNTRFPTEDKGDIEWFLGIKISRDRRGGTITLSQKLYVEDVVQRFAPFIRTGHCRSYVTPMEEGIDLSNAPRPAPGTREAAALSEAAKTYHSVVGSILWLANVTRFDVSYAASQLSKYMSDPAPAHISAAVRVLVYLSNTAERSLTYTPRDLPLQGLTDSSWTSNFSVSGSMVFFRGCLVSWFAKGQKSVSLSSAEAEIFASMMCAKNVIFHRDLALELGESPRGPTTIFTDNKAVVDMSLDPVAFKRTQHILRSANFLRDLVAKGIVELLHIPGAQNAADVFTKAQGRAAFLESLRVADNWAELAGGFQSGYSGARAPSAPSE